MEREGRRLAQREREEGIIYARRDRERERGREKWMSYIED